MAELNSEDKQTWTTVEVTDGMEREFIMADLTSITESGTKLQFADLAFTVLFIMFRKRGEINLGIDVDGLYQICSRVPHLGPNGCSQGEVNLRTNRFAEEN
ncbi:hypothetical protein BHE90_007436 [Fusarium euwallaceae]|uniref:Uncharacterized protein n=1 Tax=Fusarium euwallaceae TaxID=1147111 RepID=A0A430LQS7_9HYPO|nr:hypothetical protein BHE90_007436 [Fusarium euwallaceae]